MTSPAFVEIIDVRNYIELNAGSSSRYSDDTIRSNIYSASEFIERATNRYFAAQSGVTLTLSSNGTSQVDLPGVRSITSVTRAGAALTANETYWLIPDEPPTGVYTALQLQPYGTRSGPWWLAVPDWFDRNLDSPYYPGNYGSGYGVPNDLVIVADVGYLAADIPQSLKLATKALAAWYTKRPDAILTNSTTTPFGTDIGLPDFPEETRMFIEEWRIGTHTAASVG